MSPARHTTHNPRHGLGSRLGWREISTGRTTPMPDSARAESGARADWRSLHHSRLSTRSSYQLYSFSGDHGFCYDNHGSFVYDSPNLFCGPSGSVRTGLTGVRSEPGHRTHLTSLITTRTNKSPLHSCSAPKQILLPTLTALSSNHFLEQICCRYSQQRPSFGT